MTGEAMTDLVERYGNEMLRLAILYLGSREQAEDAVQDSFIKIYLSAREEAPAKSFVMRVLVNTCKDYLKSGWNRHVNLVDEYSESTVSEGDALHTNEMGELRQAVLELPPKYREIVILRYYEDFSVGEIAQILGRPQPTVSIRLKRACALLEKRLEGISREVL